jgi:hypothetical protein
MANSYFWGVQSRSREVKMVHGKVAIGATGAPTLDTAASLGIASITRDNAGLYTVTLAQKFPYFLNAHISLLDDGISQNVGFQLISEDVDGAKEIKFRCVAATDASTTTLVATELPSGCTLYITLLLQNTSVR